MKSGAEIRTIEELRECSEPETLIEYYLNGVLVRWLKAFHYDEEAENISKLDYETCKKLFEILHINFSEEKLSSVNVDEIKENLEKKVEEEKNETEETSELDKAKEELKKKVDYMSEDELVDQFDKIVTDFENTVGFDFSLMKCKSKICLYKEDKFDIIYSKSRQKKIFDIMRDVVLNSKNLTFEIFCEKVSPFLSVIKE